MNNLVHHLPGRLRLKVPNLRGNQRLAAVIDEQLMTMPGVTSVRANPRTGKVLVYFNSLRTDHNSIIIRVDEIQNAGTNAIQPQYHQYPKNLIPFREPEELSLGRQVLQVMFSGAVLLLLFFKHRTIGRSPLSNSSQLFHLATITTIITGYPIFCSGLEQLATRRRVNYNLVISATAMALLILRESFSGLLVTWVVNLSSLLQTLNLIKAHQSIKNVVELSGADVWLLVNGSELSVPVNRIVPGDIIVVHPGESIPVDGTIVSGEASVDESRITGLPSPGYKNTGGEVLAGSQVLDGTIHIRVERAGRETYVSKIIDNVDSQLKPDRYGVYPADDRRSERLISLSLILSGVVYLLTRNTGRSLAMLLAACPSALSLAAPSAIGSAIGGAAHRGIYVRDGKYLLAAGHVDTVVFDKTGTLTTPNSEIAEVVVVNKTYTAEEVIAFAALAEGISGHPVAKAVRHKASQMHVGPHLAAEQITAIPGLGVVALVSNQQVLVGNERLMTDRQVSLSKIRAKVTRFRHLGLSPVFVAVEGKLCGLLAIRESLKPGSLESIERLRVSGIDKMVLLTGDSQNAAEMTAGKLGIEESYGGFQPEQKAEVVHSLRNQGRTTMVVGDGINDIQAMADADTSIALGCTGVESAACAGGIVIPAHDPLKVVEAIRLGQETREVIKQNYSFATGVNVIGLGLAAAGLINPLSAGLFTNIATLAVIINSMGLSKKKGPARQKKTIYNNSPPPRGHRKSKAPAQAELLNNMPPATGWHLADSNEVLLYLGSDKTFGLTALERELRITRFGPNKLSIEKKISWLSLLAEPFRDFMVQLLLGASVVSLLVGEYADAFVIVAIVGVEAVLGVVQGLKAEKSLAALKTLTAPSAKVLIEGEVIETKADQLVPGDIILLEEGDSVPADCRLINTTNLELDESSLTGESVPVVKDAEVCRDAGTILADRFNMIYMGTCTTKGRGLAIVVETGMSTEMGRLAQMLQDSEPEPTPLQLQLGQLGRQLSLGCLLVCGGVVTAGLLRGRPLMEMLRTGVSLAVGAIPEGLPAVVTIAMAFGVQRMVKGHAIVRSLPAVETLGGATVICTDKTGTLTKNEMTVTEIYSDGRIWHVTGEGYLPQGEFQLDSQPVSAIEDKYLCRILTASALCNNADISYTPGEDPQVLGDPTEVALLTAAVKGGVPWPGVKDSYCRQREVSFDSKRKMMTVVCHDSEGEASLYTKGALDVILNKCTRVFRNNRIVSLDVKARDKIISANEDMASRALRVLAVAYRPLSETGMPEDELEQDLIFLGILGMVDPPRPGVYEAVQKCRQAGIKVVMVTGDHPTTATAIAKKLDMLRDGVVLSGYELDKMSDEQLSSIIDRVEVCSRTTPEHKLRIVKAFKNRGHVVAMTGDGVNDAPSLKEADVGIAMGKKGTDVTREAAAITLTDDNFATIVTAVEEGRTVGDNIRKSIRYVLAGNFGEVLAIFIAAVSGMPLPLVPSQILCVNLVTESIPAMAMGADPPDPAVMTRPPRKSDESIISGGLSNAIVTHSVLTGLTTFGIFAGTLMLGGNLAKARTMAFTNLVVSQLFNFFDCRKGSAAANEQGRTNKLMIPSAGASAALLLSAIYVPPLGALFQTVPLGIGDWGILLFMTGLVGRVDNLFRRSSILPAPVSQVIALPEPKKLPVGSLEESPLDSGTIYAGYNL